MEFSDFLVLISCFPQSNQDTQSCIIFLVFSSPFLPSYFSSFFALLFVLRLRVCVPHLVVVPDQPGMLGSPSSASPELGSPASVLTSVLAALPVNQPSQTACRAAGRCLSQCSIAVKRHCYHCTSCKRKHLIAAGS